MRAVLQRVRSGSVKVAGEVKGEIGKGVVILLGVGKEDTPQDCSLLADKIANLRIFDDSEGKMNLSLLDVGGEALVVSQFTLYGDCRKGRRPGYSDAAPPELANELYERFKAALSRFPVPVKSGIFQAMMVVSIENDGPVTILLDTKKAF